MRLIWRELAGWLLVVFGLVLAGTCLQLLGISQFLIAGVVGIAALGVLLGGGLLLGSLSLEVAGWLLVLAGVGVLFECYVLIVQGSRLFQAGPLSIIGIIVFRGGIHLLKVAVAARICSQARERTQEDVASKPPARKPTGRTAAATTIAARGS